MNNPIQRKPMILSSGMDLRYAFEIACQANSIVNHVGSVLGVAEVSYGYTQKLLGIDTQIIDTADVTPYYEGRGRRSLELSAALNVAIGVLAQRITNIFKETNPEKLEEAKRENGLAQQSADDALNLQNWAEEKIYVSDEAAAFLEDSENREQMRGRFPEAGLTDEVIFSVIACP